MSFLIQRSWSLKWYRNTKNGKLLPKNEEICGGKAQTDTRKLTWCILTIADVFFNWKKVNVCEHTVKMALMWCYLYCVLTYIYYFDWERHLWSSKYIKYVSVSILLNIMFLHRSTDSPHFSDLNSKINSPGQATNKNSNF